MLGLNGSGKSSLLRILAGVDKKYEGQITVQSGYTIGYLEQEPVLDDSLTVRQTVEQGMQATIDLLKEFEKINEQLAEPMDDEKLNKLLEKQGQVQEKLDATERVGNGYAARDGDGCVALSAGRCVVQGFVGWRETAGGALPVAVA